MSDAYYLLIAVGAFTIFMHIWMTMHYYKYEPILKSMANDGVDENDFELLSDFKDENHSNSLSQQTIKIQPFNFSKFIKCLFFRVEICLFSMSDYSKKFRKYFIDSFLDLYHNNMIGVVYIGAGFLIIAVGLRGIGELQGWPSWLIDENNGRFALKFVLLALGSEFCLVVNLGLMMIFTPEIRTFALRNILRTIPEELQKLGKALNPDNADKSKYTLKTTLDKDIIIEKISIEPINELKRQTAILQKFENALQPDTAPGNGFSLKAKIDKELIDLQKQTYAIMQKLQEAFKLINTPENDFTLKTRDKELIALQNKTYTILEKLEKSLTLINSQGFLLKTKDDELIKLQNETTAIMQKLGKAIIKDANSDIYSLKTKVEQKPSEQTVIEAMSSLITVFQAYEKGKNNTNP